MNITFFDSDENMCNAWVNKFLGTPEINISNVPVSDIPYHDYLVIPGNHIGLMIDGSAGETRDFFGFAIQDTLQEYLSDNMLYLDRGESIILNMNDTEHFKHIIYVPVSRPKNPPVTLDISYALIVALQIAIESGANSIAIPGMGYSYALNNSTIVANGMYNGYKYYKNLLVEGVSSR